MNEVIKQVSIKHMGTQLKFPYTITVTTKDFGLNTLYLHTNRHWRIVQIDGDNSQYRYQTFDKEEANIVVRALHYANIKYKTNYSE